MPICVTVYTAIGAGLALMVALVIIVLLIRNR